MAAPIVYRWDDGNAPVARGERRSLCDILYACLVTGYGAKPAAGWTREYVNATFDKAVFRNNPVTGTGFFLQIDGNSTTNAHENKTLGYESMSSVDNGLGPFISGSTPIVRTSNAAGTTARPWVLIADDRAFYFICWYSITGPPTNSTPIATGMYFGDIVTLNPSDAYACGITTYTSVSTVVSYGVLTAASAGTVAAGVSFPRNSGGVAAPIVPIWGYGGGPSVDIGREGPVYTPGGALYIARPYVGDGIANSIRGFMPGFYYPCHPLGSFNQFETIAPDGMSLMYLTHYAGGSQSQKGYFISLNDWRV